MSASLHSGTGTGLHLGLEERTMTPRQHMSMTDHTSIPDPEDDFWWAYHLAAREARANVSVKEVLL